MVVEAMEVMEVVEIVQLVEGKFVIVGGVVQTFEKGQNFSFLELHREGWRAQAEQLVFFVIHDIYWGALEDGVLHLGAGFISSFSSSKFFPRSWRWSPPSRGKWG